MPNLSVTVAEAGRALGLQVTPTTSMPLVETMAYGVKDGYPVQLARGHDEGQECVTTLVRYDAPARDAAVREAVTQSPTLRERKITPGQVHVGEGVLVYRHHRNWFRSIRPETVTMELDALLTAVKLATTPPAAVCRLCGSTSGSTPILLNGVIDRVCPGCIERLQHEAKRAMARYEDQPANLPLAVIVAAGLALVTALGWAGAAIATHRMFWVIAVVGGVLVGWGTTRAAGRCGRPVQAVGVVFTLLGVLLGEILRIGYYVREYVMSRNLTINWMDFVEAVPRLLWAGGSDTLFALGGGVIGAYYAARRAAKPTLEVTVEKPAS
jgi:hypothetical protein